MIHSLYNNGDYQYFFMLMPGLTTLLEHMVEAILAKLPPGSDTLVSCGPRKVLQRLVPLSSQ